MGAKGICLLVANDDLTCRNMVDQMLQSCTYEVLHIGRAVDVLMAIWEKKDTIDLVVTNVHRLEEKGFEILNHIQEEFNYPTILMKPDDNIIKSKGQESVFSAYVLKILNINDINNLWELALTTERAKQVGANEEGTAEMDSAAQNAHEAGRVSTPSVGDGSRTWQKTKRKELKEKSEQSEASGDDQPMEKKPRVVWTKEMHQKFLEAIEMLGPDKAFPKKIVEAMNMPGLTRENVASHLQKYRMCLKRTQDDSGGSSYASQAREPSFLSCLSAFNFSSSQAYSNVIHQPYGTHFQQGSCGVMSMDDPSQPCSSTARLSTSISHLRLAEMLAGDNQGTLQQLCNANLVSTLEISDKSSYVHFANSQCTDQIGFTQMQSKYVTRKPVNSSFRVYGDQTKNMLLSIEGSSSSNNATMPSNSNCDCSFIGLRLTSDGKAVEFGESNVSDIPSTSTSYVQGPPDTLLQKGSNQDELSDQYPSISIDCISMQEPFLSLLGSSMEESSMHCPSVPVYFASQQDRPLSGNVEEFGGPSNPVNGIPQEQSFPPVFETPANRNEDQSPTLQSNFSSQQQTILLPLCPPASDNSAQYSSTTIISDHQPPTPVQPSRTSMDENAIQHSMMVASEQEISTTFLGSSGIQEPSTSTHQTGQKESSIPPSVPFIEHEPESFGPEEELDILLHETRSTSPQLFWERDFANTLFNHAD